MRLLLLLGLLCAAAPARAERLDPATTYALVVGVLHWQDSASFGSFPAADRKDRELDDTLGRRGVPASHRTILLDEDATTAKITAALAKLVAAAPVGSTLLFYYAGHGGPAESGNDTVLVSYDTRGDDMAGTGLTVAAITQELAAFKGDRVLLLGDACYTGGLAAAAQALATRHVAAASLTSATASNTSTQNWTFTQTVIDALNGRSELDADGDRAIDLVELDTAVGDAMSYREHQAHGFANHGLPAHLILADAQPARLARSKLAWVQAVGPSDQLETAKVLGERNGRLLLSFYSYATETQRWFAPGEVTALPSRPATPATVLVEWHGQWWDATVVATRGARTCIHYVGYAASWDECVEAARLRAP